MAKKWDDVKGIKEADFNKEVTALPDTDERKALQTKVKSLKKWPVPATDTGTLTAVKKLYDAAVSAKAAAAPQEIVVGLTSYTKPKFAHNATAAGTLPKWTFTYVDAATKKSGTVVIEMTKSMTKDEPTAKKMMADAAIAEIQKNYKGATVKMTGASLDK